MRTLFYLCAALVGLAACSGGSMKGDHPNKTDEGPKQGQPMDSSTSERQRLPETTPDKERPYADDKSTEQTTTAPPDPEPK